MTGFQLSGTYCPSSGGLVWDKFNDVPLGQSDRGHFRENHGWSNTGCGNLQSQHVVAFWIAKSWLLKIWQRISIFPNDQILWKREILKTDVSGTEWLATAFWGTLNRGLVLRYKTGTSHGGSLTSRHSAQEMCARAGLLQAVLNTFAFYRRSGDHVHTGGVECGFGWCHQAWLDGKFLNQMELLEHLLEIPIILREFAIVLFDRRRVLQ